MLLVVSSARAQFVFLEQERTVGASATVDYVEIHLRDGQIRTAPDFGLFDETVMASVRDGVWSGSATAWQYSNLTANEIIARGGPRAVSASGFPETTRSAGAGSTTRVEFRLAVPTLLHLHAEILDPPDYEVLGDIFDSGDVSFSLSGPNLAIILPPTSGTEMELPTNLLTVIDETRWLEAGDYLLDVWAVHQLRGDTSLFDVYYDVRLTAQPIPEPSCFALGLLSLCVTCRIRRRYSLAHFGK